MDIGKGKNWDYFCNLLWLSTTKATPGTRICVTWYGSAGVGWGAGRVIDGEEGKQARV